MIYPKATFYDNIMGELTLEVGKYNALEEFEPEIYYIGIFDDDDFEIQYDSLSLEHVLDTFTVVSKFINRANFTEYFSNYCKDNYLINQMGVN